MYYIHYKNHVGRLDGFSGYKFKNKEKAIALCKKINLHCGVSGLEGKRFKTIFKNYTDKLEVLAF